MSRSLQAAEKIPWALKHNAVVDALFMAAFVSESLYIVYSCASGGGAPEVATLFVAIALTAAAVYFVEHGAVAFGTFLSDGPLGRVPFNSPLGSKKTMNKWKAQSWQFVIHTTMAAAEAHVLMSEPWLREPSTTFEPIPEIQEPRSDAVKYVYLAQLAIWMYTCYCHVFVNEEQKDYYVMYAHHVVTIGLVGISYAMNYHRIGLIVLFVHDFSDIFIDLVKLLNYLKLEGPAGWYAAECCFVTVLSTWAYYRLYVFPAKIIYEGSWPGCFREGWITPSGNKTLGLRWKQHYHDDSKGFESAMFSCYVTNTLLISLFAMHIWWFGLLLNMIVKKLSSPKTNWNEAAAEAYEGEDGKED